MITGGNRRVRITCPRLFPIPAPADRRETGPEAGISVSRRGKLYQIGIPTPRVTGSGARRSIRRSPGRESRRIARQGMSRGIRSNPHGSKIRSDPPRQTARAVTRITVTIGVIRKISARPPSGKFRLKDRRKRTGRGRSRAATERPRRRASDEKRGKKAEPPKSTFLSRSARSRRPLSLR